MGRRFTIINFVLLGLILIGIGLAVFFARQQQSLRSRASGATSLKFNATSVTKNVNEAIPLDIILTSGPISPASINLEITFDPSKLTPSDNGFTANNPYTISSGPTMSNGKIQVGIVLPNLPPSQETKIATVTFRTVSVTQTPIQVSFGPGTTATSSDASGSAQLSSLASSTPVTITIADPTPTQAPSLSATIPPTQPPTPAPTTLQVTPTNTTSQPSATPGLSQITGVVFEDTNRNGTKDTGERIFDNSAIRVTGGLNNSFNGTIYTKGNGLYSVENLPAGIYTVTAITPINFTPSTPASVKVTVPPNGEVNFGFGALTTAYYLERFPWSYVSVSTVSPAKIYTLLRYRSGFSADIISNQANFEYRWESTDQNILTLVPFAECSNGIVPPCPNDRVTLTGHKAGPVIVKVSVVDKTNNQEIANTYYIVTVVAPTVGPTPTPFIPSFSLSLLLHGIGSSGDSVSTNSASSNKNPVIKSQPVKVELFNYQNQLVASTSGTVNYNVANGNFTGNIPMSSVIPSGSYIVKIKTNQHLRKVIPGVFVVPSLKYPLPPAIDLIVGDINNDNRINLLDYNMLIDCYSDDSPARACNPFKKLQADLNSDGEVNFVDYNLFVRDHNEQFGE